MQIYSQIVHWPRILRQVLTLNSTLCNPGLFQSLNDVGASVKKSGSTNTLNKRTMPLKKSSSTHKKGGTFQVLESCVGSKMGRCYIQTSYNIQQSIWILHIIDTMPL